MITDIYAAAIAGARGPLPALPVYNDNISWYRKTLSIDAEKPHTYVPLIRAIGAFPFTQNGIGYPIIPLATRTSPSIVCGDQHLEIAWTGLLPPKFVHRPKSLPIPLRWTLTRLTETAALLTNDVGHREEIPCAHAHGVLVPEWLAWVGATMGAKVSQENWELHPVIFSIPPLAYPYAHADTLLDGPEVRQLLAEADLLSLHTSLLRPDARVATVSAAVVKVYLREAQQVSDGTKDPLYTTGGILTMDARPISLNRRPLSLDV